MDVENLGLVDNVYVEMALDGLSIRPASPEHDEVASHLPPPSLVIVSCNKISTNTSVAPASDQKPSTL